MKAVIKNYICRKNERGQHIVELALITPLVLVALYIPADFGIAFLTADLAQNAVREGARIGSGLTSQDPDHPIKSTQGTAIKAAVFARLPQRLSDPSVNVKFYFNSATATCMQIVEVTATGTYDYALYRLMGLIGKSVPAQQTITRTTQMRYNYQLPGNNTPICGTIDFDQTYGS